MNLIKKFMSVLLTTAMVLMLLSTMTLTVSAENNFTDSPGPAPANISPSSFSAISPLSAQTAPGTPGFVNIPGWGWGWFANGTPIIVRQNGNIATIYHAVTGEALTGSDDMIGWPIFGGWADADYIGNTSVIVESGTLGWVFGGNFAGSITGNTNVTVKNGEMGDVNVNRGGGIYGGSRSGTITGDTRVTVDNGSIRTLYGGNRQGLVKGNTHITINDGSAEEIYAGGWEGNVDGNTHIEFNGGRGNEVYGGSVHGNVNGSTNVTITGGNNFRVIYGGGFNGNITGNTNVTVKNATFYAQSPGTYSSIFGGGRVGTTVEGNTSVLVESSGPSINVYGGGYGDVTGDTTVVIRSDVNMVFGGGLYAHVGGSTNVTMESGEVIYIFGGGFGDGGNVAGNTTLTLLGGRVTLDAHGGGFGSNVTGTAIVNKHPGVTVDGIVSEGGRGPSSVGPDSKIVTEFDPVPPTGVTGITGAVSAMLMLFAISAVLWGMVIRRRFSRV